MKLRAKMPIDLPTMEPDIAKSRKALEAMLAPQVAQMLKAYPVDVAETKIAGVPTRVVTPKGKSADADARSHQPARRRVHDVLGILLDAGIGAHRIGGRLQSRVGQLSHGAGSSSSGCASRMSPTVYRELLKSLRAKAHRHLRLLGGRRAHCADRGVAAGA